MKTTTTYPLLGMTCLSCADSARSMLQSIPGVHTVQVDFNGQKVTVDFDESKVGYPQMQAAMVRIGYELVPDRGALVAARRAQMRMLRWKLLVAVACTLPVFVLSMGWVKVPYSSWIELALTLPVVFYSGRSFYTAAWDQARRGLATMDTLVAVGTGAAFLLSLWVAFWPDTLPGLAAHLHFESAAIILVFILVGKYLEENARQGTNQAVERLLDLTQAEATVIRDGQEIRVDATVLLVGETVRVAPGERLPCDGVLETAEAELDESMLSGEAEPALKRKGDTLAAGTLNLNQRIELKVTRTGGQTLLASIIRQVEAAQATQAPAQRLADRIAAVFVPLVLFIALATALGWGFLAPVWINLPASEAWGVGLLNALTVLIISCPCALGLATPVAIKVAIGRAAELGLLVRNANALEKAAQLQLIFFDKTGTLTEGKPSVMAIWPAPLARTDATKLAQLAAGSRHPHARAIARHLVGEVPNAPADLMLLELPGRGLRAKWQDESWLLGNAALLQEAQVNLPPQAEMQAAAWRKAGFSLVYWALGTELKAIFALSDALRPDTLKALNELQAEGIRLEMITGDNAETAQRLAAGLPLQAVHAGLLPIDKSKRVQQAREGGTVVGMVGDGINDAIALAQADVGMATAEGTDVALESAPITLFGSRLTLVPALIRLSRRTRAVIRGNLFWAFAYNLIALPVATGIFYPFALPPAVAGASMAFSSLAVVLNSLRIRTVK